MLRTRARLTMAALVLLIGTVTGCGEEDSADSSDSGDTTGEVTVTEAWVRSTKGTEDPSMTAGFMAIENGTDEDVTLESASSDLTDMVELHEMVMVDGEMMMQETEDGIPIEAGKTQMLMPGGYHVMFMGLSGKPLKPGEEVEFTLTFSDGTELDLTAPVKEFTEEEGHYHSPGTDPDHGHGGD